MRCQALETWAIALALGCMGVCSHGLCNAPYFVNATSSKAPHRAEASCAKELKPGGCANDKFSF